MPSLVGHLGNSISRIVLISPFISSFFSRIVLSAIQIFPEQFIANWLSNQLMRWSEKNVDFEELQALRLELYDDPSLVASRWLQRLLSIRQGLTWLDIENISENHNVTIIFGEDELLNKLQHRKVKIMASKCPKLTIYRLSGGHEIGTLSPVCLQNILEIILNN